MGKEAGLDTVSTTLKERTNKSTTSGLSGPPFSEEYVRGWNARHLGMFSFEQHSADWERGNDDYRKAPSHEQLEMR